MRPGTRIVFICTQPAPLRQLESVKPVLRITNVVETERTVTLKVEGEIASIWSAVLETECRRQLDRGKELVLDFSSVTLVDRQGAHVVSALQPFGVTLVGCSPLLDEQIRRLASNGKL